MNYLLTSGLRCSRSHPIPPLPLRHRPLTAVWLVLAALLFFAIAGIAIPPARASVLVPATTFTVTKTADTNDGACSSDCSLREAVLAANASPGADTIIVPAGTYSLTLTGSNEDAAATGDLDLTDSVAITGAGADSTAIEARVSDRVFHILTGVTATVSGVTIRNGSAATDGGGILNDGTLTLNDCVVTMNQAASGYSGGGIANRGVLSLNRNTVSNNSATFGGGIFSQARGVAVSMYSSTVSGNNAAYGGGIYTFPGTFAMTGTAVLNNVASDGGGGIDNAGILTLAGSTVRENRAGHWGGGIYVETGAVTVTTSAIVTNSVTSQNNPVLGGAIFSLGSVTIADSTISGNSANADNACTASGCSTSYQSYGGAIFNSSGLKLVNSTLNHNSAWYRSGYNGYTAGTGAGLYNGGIAEAKNTILANSRGYNDTETGNCAGSLLAITSLGHNLDSGYTCGLADPTDKVSIDPLLGPPQSYWGSPPVNPLQPGSPALDGGDNAGCTATDQRGFPRPFDGDANGTATCDIGAFEFGSYTATVALASSANPSVVGQSVTFTATLSPSAGIPGGTVALKDESTVICAAVPIVGGRATCAFGSPGPSVHSISAAYSGDDRFSAAAGNLSGGQTVQKAATTTSISSHSPSYSKVGQPVTVNYAVVVTAPGSATPSGNVTVTDGVDACTASVAAGSCTLTLTTAGTRSLATTYAGDNSLLGSVSTPVAHAVSPAFFNLYLPLVVR